MHFVSLYRIVPRVSRALLDRLLPRPRRIMTLSRGYNEEEDSPALAPLRLLYLRNFPFTRHRRRGGGFTIMNRARYYE